MCLKYILFSLGLRPQGNTQQRCLGASCGLTCFSVSGYTTVLLQCWHPSTSILATLTTTFVSTVCFMDSTSVKWHNALWCGQCASCTEVPVVCWQGKFEWLPLWHYPDRLKEPKSYLTAAENLVFVTPLWFNCSPGCSDVQVDSRTLWHYCWTAVMLGVVRCACYLKCET